MSLLQVEDLRTYFYTDQGVSRAVDGVSFNVDVGETVGIVGESGCGKTVTSLSLLGLVPDPPGRIESGSSIRLDGEELVEASDRRLRDIRGNDISMIFQEPMTSLNPVLRVGTQLVEVLRLHRKMTRAEAKAEAVGLLGEMGIPEPGRRIREYPHQLSGGMRQRVMIAMALACEPRLLIADEPTTALDVTIQAQILELLASVTRDRGMSMLLITHDLGVVAEVCDRVIVMYGGQVVESGSVTEVFTNPKHPYTIGLLNSIPTLTGEVGRLDPIPGSVPDPHDWPRGCRFRERCSQAHARCDEPPELVPVDDSDIRCWLAVHEDGAES